MNLHRNIVVILLLIIPLSIFAQRYVSGRVTDSEFNEPIPGASVFIAGTTVGMSTDTEGYFRLAIPGQGSYKLTVSHVGYQPVFVDIEPGQKSIRLNVVLSFLELGEVTVSAKVKFRKDDVDYFWKTILGELPSKRVIYAANPEVVFFYYNRETNFLTVTCREPLKIINLETGYQIEYVLDRFTHDFNTKITFWEAQYMFRELVPANFKQKNTWEKNREKVNKVSVSKFIKSLYNSTPDNKSLDNNGFLLLNFIEHKTQVMMDDQSIRTSRGLSIPNRNKEVEKAVFEISLAPVENYLSTDTVSNSKNLYVPQDSSLMLVCYGKPLVKNDVLFLRLAQEGQTKWSFSGLHRNKVKTPNGPVQIFPDGTFKNTLFISSLFSSRMLTGLNMALPVEYDYVVDSVAVNDNIENETILDDSTNIAPTKNPLLDSLEIVAKRFDMQLSIFPQEKVYIHTDKPYYISGEKIWFRAHVVDAALHTPSISTNCVFVELFNANDSAVCRVKTSFENNMYSGYISIPEDIPEGDYNLRAYTNLMRNLDEDYFFMKNIRIGNPATSFIRAIPEFIFTSDKKINTIISFFNPLTSTLVNPETVRVGINNDIPLKIKPLNGIATLNFNLSANEKQRLLLLEAIDDRRQYLKNFRIPYPDSDFDVSFYPEGGQSIIGCLGRIAFKSMQHDGTVIDINGIVYDGKGNEITKIKTDVCGMGYFVLMPEPGETYYAVCTNSKGHSIRVKLPDAKKDSYALNLTWNRDLLLVKVLHNESISNEDTLCLIIHTRGIVQDFLIIENTNKPVILKKDLFPSGVSNLLLLTKNMIPVSERLVFVNNEDNAKVITMTDKEIYPLNSPVNYTVNITDDLGEPLTGNFSVSVTDDNEVASDTISNILTSLLLSSDLRGNISDPSFYFQKNSRSVWALELLMMTQGWRRYDNEMVVKKQFKYPDAMLEKGFEISGTVKGVLSGKPEENAIVSIVSQSGDYFSNTITDRNGWFFFHDGDAHDSTRFIIRAAQKTGKRPLEITLNKEWFPERNIPAIASKEPEQDIFLKYADKAEKQYTYEHGNRIIQLSEVTITGQKRPKRTSSYYFKPDKTITEEELDRRPASSMRQLLNRLPGVVVGADGAAYITKYQVSRSSVNYKPVVSTMDTDTGTVNVANEGYDQDYCYATYLVDDFPAQSIDWLEPADVAQVDLLTSPTNLMSFGQEGKCGVIAIYTRIGRSGVRRQKKDISSILPLGFQKPVEFYAPKYDLPDKNKIPDLRTTIHWQPLLKTDENGMASFNFYTADFPSTYSMVIEGVTDNGRIIYKHEKIKVTQITNTKDTEIQ